MEENYTPYRQPQSRYVRLEKDKAPLEDITPGELNQPVQIPQTNGLRCHECGQPLPEKFEPPANEDWTTGIFDCAEDPESCKTGLFCPCVLFANNLEMMNEDIPRNNACLCHAFCIEGGIALAAATALFHGIDPQTSFLISEGLVFGWWLCGIYTGVFRQNLQRKYHLKDEPAEPCMVHCLFHWCAVCQEHREMKNRLSENSALPMTIINPPPVQEMNSGENHHHHYAPSETPAPASGNSEHAKLETRAL